MPTNDATARMSWDAQTSEIAKRRAKELATDFENACAYVLWCGTKAGLSDMSRAMVFHAAMRLVEAKWDWPEYNKNPDYRRLMKSVREHKSKLEEIKYA